MPKRVSEQDAFNDMLPEFMPCIESKRCNNKALNLRQLEAKMHHIASSIHLPLDAPLTAVTRISDGTIRVLATAKDFPSSEDERKMAESALYSVLVDWITLEVERATVHVHIPPVQQNTLSLTSATYSIVPSQWIRQQVESVNEWAFQCSRTIATATLTRVVETYPWRNKHIMSIMIPSLVLRAMDNMAKGLPEPLMLGNVDVILPPISQFLLPFDIDLCKRDIVTKLRVNPTSLLEFYETVFAIVQSGQTKTTATLILYNNLFV